MRRFICFFVLIMTIQTGSVLAITNESAMTEHDLLPMKSAQSPSVKCTTLHVPIVSVPNFSLVSKKCGDLLNGKTVQTFKMKKTFTSRKNYSAQDAARSAAISLNKRLPKLLSKGWTSGSREEDWDEDGNPMWVLAVFNVNEAKQISIQGTATVKILTKPLEGCWLENSTGTYCYQLKERTWITVTITVKQYLWESDCNEDC